MSPARCRAHCRVKIFKRRLWRPAIPPCSPSSRSTSRAAMTASTHSSRKLIGGRPGRSDPLKRTVSYFAQVPDGRRRKLLAIDTPSQSVRSLIQAEPEPIRVSVASLRNMSGERKYHASTFNPSRRIAEASAARCSCRCRRNDFCWL